MKTINNITKKLTLITGIMVGALLLSTNSVSADPTEKAKKDSTANTKIEAVESAVLEYLEKEESLMLEFKALNKPTVKVFNHNDELVYEGFVKDMEDIKDKKLLSLLHKSDFLMRFENTSYYKLNQ